MNTFFLNLAEWFGIQEVDGKPSNCLLRPLHLKQSSMWSELAIDASVNACLSMPPCDKLATCPQQEIHFACRQLPEAPAAQMTEELEGGAWVVLASWSLRGDSWDCGAGRSCQPRVDALLVVEIKGVCVEMTPDRLTPSPDLPLWTSEVWSFSPQVFETHTGATSSYREPSSRWWFKVCS